MILTRMIWAVAATIVVTVGMILLGVEPLFALGYGVLAGVLVISAILRYAGEQVLPSPHHRREPVTRGSEISRLAWGFNPRTQLAGETVARRARAVLGRRLARLGIDAENDRQRVDEILGSGVWERLSTRKASVSDIEHALAVTATDTQETT